MARKPFGPRMPSAEKLRQALESLEAVDQTLYDLDLTEEFEDGLIEEIQKELDDEDNSTTEAILKPIMKRLEGMLEQVEGESEPFQNPRKRRRS